MEARKQDRKWSEKFQTIALFKDDIKLLKKLADKEQRSMARQLSVIIQKAVAEQKAHDTINYTARVSALPVAYLE